MTIADASLGKWLFLCDCGVTKEMHSGNVRDGKTVSCGCQKKARASSLFTTHGMTGTGCHKTWKSMHQRVKVDADYLGIEICERWNSFENFFADMGERPKGKSIDRMNGSLGYFPDNCQWATPKEQCINRSNTVMLEFEGKSMCASDWAKEIGISRKGIMKRLNKGWPVDQVLSSGKYVRKEK